MTRDEGDPFDVPVADAVPVMPSGMTGADIRPELTTATRPTTDAPRRCL